MVTVAMVAVAMVAVATLAVAIVRVTMATLIINTVLKACGFFKILILGKLIKYFVSKKVGHINKTKTL